MSQYITIKEIHRTFGRRWGGTGSPASNGLEGLFGQAYAIAEEKPLGPYVTNYLTQYFDQSYDRHSYTIKEGAEKEIYKKLKPFFLRLEAKDLPPVVDNDILFDLPPEVREIYDQLHDDLITKIDSKVVTAANMGIASGKCRQVASGGLYYEPEIEGLFKDVGKTKRQTLDLHDLKTDVVEDLVNELQGKPLLVAYDFNHDLERLQRRFGKDLPYIGKGVSDKRAAQVLRWWNAGQLPILAGHPASMGHGLNIQGNSCHIAHYSTTWDLELYDQFIRRLRRRGTKATRIFNHRIIARGTVDEAVPVTLKNKNLTQTGLFEALKRMRRSRG